jgi:hypothetical protein
MLGCHDFCGYYDWTFHHVRSTFGDAAVRSLWSEAIGDEAQQHYAKAACTNGLRGLLNVWNQTGDEEHCDWTFTFEEENNILRWDMRQCPSKGFLLDNDLHADEDYCDHCIGWIAPLLAKHGLEFAGHEHNHRGQCWGEMRVRGKPYQPLELPGDIRNDARWRHGFIDRFDAAGRTSTDAAEAIEGCSAIVIDEEYVNRRPPCDAILLGDNDNMIRVVAALWSALPQNERPLLLHAYLPRSDDIDFLSLGLPRPLPILPLLIRTGVYVHTPGSSPRLVEQLRLLNAACQTHRDADNSPSR